MINLRGMANGIITSVNPNMNAVLSVNVGYTVDDYGKQVPQYETHTISIQPQSLSSSEKDHLDLVSKQGEYISVYAFGDINAMQRLRSRGESKLTFRPYGESESVEWNVDQVLESYRTWVRLLLVRVS